MPPGLFGWMRARAVDGAEVATDESFARTLRLDGGPAWFELRLDDFGRVRLRARLSSLGDLPTLVTRARRLFDLDADPVAVDEALAQHPELAPLVAAVPGIRVPGAADPHEMLIRAMVGQQITVAAARTALTTLTGRLGDDVDGFDGATKVFPSMAAIAERGHEVLRGPAARIRALIGAAGALADGSLRLTAGDDAAEQRAALLAMPGIGPWTADYVRMRVTGDPDVFLPGDVAVRAGAAAAGIPSEAATLTAWAARTAPWRSYLTAHLWRATARATTPSPGMSGRGQHLESRRSPSSARAPRRSYDTPHEGDIEMTATIQTIDTPDGAFTIVADDRGRVLASGWTADAEAALIRIHPRLRPASVVDGETDAAAAALAYYAGDITAIDGVEVAQDGTAMQSAGWAALRRSHARSPALVRRVRRRARPAERGAGRGIHLRAQRAGALRAVPPRAARRRQPGRIRVGPRRQAQPARSRGRRVEAADTRFAGRFPETRRAPESVCIQRTPRYTLEGCRARAQSVHSRLWRMPCIRSPSPRRPPSSSVAPDFRSLAFEG